MACFRPWISTCCMVRPTAQAKEAAAGTNTGHQRRSQLAGASGLATVSGSGPGRGQTHLGDQLFF